MCIISCAYWPCEYLFPSSVTSFGQFLLVLFVCVFGEESFLSLSYMCFATVFLASSQELSEADEIVPFPKTVAVRLRGAFLKSFT